MSIIKLRPEAAPELDISAPREIPKPYESQFESLTPMARIDSLLTYVEGAPWTVNYYSQVLNKDNPVNSPDATTPSLLQPYIKITGLVLKVSSPISSSYNSDTGVTTIIGTALVPKSVTPNVGDAFLAQVDSGEDAFFVVNTVERKTHRKLSLYEITYSLFTYASRDPAFFASIEEKVQSVVFYNEEPHQNSHGELITPRVKEARDRLSEWLRRSMADYNSRFIDRKSGTFVVPGQPDILLFDPLMFNFINRLMNFEEYYHRRRLPTPYDYIGDRYINQLSILNILETRFPDHIYTATKRFGFVARHNFSGHAPLAPLSVTLIDRILYPQDADTTSFSSGSVPVLYDEEGSLYHYPIESYRTPPPEPDPIVDPPVLPAWTPVIQMELSSKNLLHPLFENGYYIVSENFYNYMEENTEQTAEAISYTELLIAKYIKREGIALEDLVVATQDYTKWSWLHQFYLLPVYWLIIRNQRVM